MNEPEVVIDTILDTIHGDIFTNVTFDWYGGNLPGRYALVKDRDDLVLSAFCARTQLV